VSTSPSAQSGKSKWSTSNPVAALPAVIAPERPPLVLSRRGLLLGTVAAILVVATFGVLRANHGPAATSGGTSGNKDLVIATFFATTCIDAADQLPAQYAAQLAVSQARLPDSYKLTVQTENYESASSCGPDTSVAGTEASALVANPNVVAIVGPFNSGIAAATMPIIQPAELTMISPANTNPGLTLEQYAQPNGLNWTQLHPSAYPDSYFRIPGNDVVQGKVDAAVATSAPISAKTAYVVDDDTTYGIGLANYFTLSFKAHGGKMVGIRTHIEASQISNLSSLASTIAAANPDVIFYGGVTSGGGTALKHDLVADGYTKPMVVGDGIADDPAFIPTAGYAAAINTYGSLAAPDTSMLTATADVTFKNDYTTYVAGKPNNTLLPYSAMSYDVAKLEIQAIINVIKSGKAVTRLNVRNAVAAINYHGLTGDIHFDSNGDNAGATVFSIYEVDPTTDKWVFRSQVAG
jgi:branched-chain amino acid transport system substrate-binding protein